MNFIIIHVLCHNVQLVMNFSESSYICRLIMIFVDSHAEAPIIIEEPEDEIIALSDSDPNQSVTFHCETRGDPQPEIVWLLGSKEIDNDDAKYVVRTQARRSGPGDYFVSSRLTIWNVDAHDAGDVVCRAIANDDNLPTALQTADSVAQLAVIGTYSADFAASKVFLSFYYNYTQYSCYIIYVRD